ncbi:hypothetical protein [Geodermatophilus amargosae]|uniref:hypothetical protein n=1 Tax=Geodermatophilus amargosae TaxID=1296565 RepID=UPI0034DE0C86
MTPPATTPPATTSTRPVALPTRARSWLRRFDAYTLEVFNPGRPYRPRPDRG